MLVEGVAVDILHHEEIAQRVLKVVDHAHDALVLELHQYPRLDFEARELSLIDQSLYRHKLAAVTMVGAVDRTHRACRDRALDHIALTEQSPRSDR